MSDIELTKHDHVLLGLIYSLQAAVMQNLGKIVNPVTGAVERDLDQARASIDVLEMLKVKCREGTPQEILRLLDATVMEAQMNFLDEKKKDEQTPPAETESAADSDTADESPAGESEAG